MSETAADFLLHVSETVTAAGYRLTLHADKTLPGDSAGLFYHGRRKEIAVATFQPMWMAILAHEFGHFLQAQRGAFVSGPDHYAMLDDWYARKRDLDPPQIAEAVRSILECEHDAESYAVSQIDRYGLCNREAYIRKANRYLFQYVISARHRQWPKFPPESEKTFPGDALLSIKELQSEKRQAKYRAIERIITTRS